VWIAIELLSYNAGCSLIDVPAGILDLNCGAVLKAPHSFLCHSAQAKPILFRTLIKEP